MTTPEHLFVSSPNTWVHEEAQLQGLSSVLYRFRKKITYKFISAQMCPIALKNIYIFSFSKKISF